MNSLYLDLLRQVLTRSLFIDHPQQKEIRRLGRDWPSDAETMIGEERLLNIQKLAETVLGAEKPHSMEWPKIPGDFMECGVWRGGAGIFMRAILQDFIRREDPDMEYSHEWDRGAEIAVPPEERISESHRRFEIKPARKVWLADSFCGLPAPNAAEYPADTGDQHHTQKALAIPLETVKANFARYGLLDDRVKFIPGFFKDSLPGPVQKLALLRVDADMYESTTQALEAMYPKLSPGGFVIVDDYRNIKNTHEAVNDFRERHKITEQIQPADSWCAIYWRKA